MFIGEKLKKIRKEKGITQKQLADALSVSVMTVQRYETNTREPKSEMIDKLCSVLGTMPEYFLISDYDSYIENSYLRDKTVILSYELNESFEKLNNTGKSIAIQRVKELTEIERYTRPDEEPPQK